VAVADADAQLVSLARAGEVEALAVLLERYRPSLYAAALALVHDREDAADLVQETCTVAVARLGSLRDPDAVGGWLHAVLRNACLMHLRRDRTGVPIDPPDGGAPVPGPEQALEQQALRDWIWTALDAIPDDERLTLILRHFTRCSSYGAIAALTGVPVGTVRSRLNRARRRLAAALDRAAEGAQRDQGALEAARRREWEHFYRALHAVPEPRTYGDLYAPRVRVRDGIGSWSGIERWAAEEREAIVLGVRATVTGLLASPDLTILEIDFHNPPRAPDHCPPSSTFVHHLVDGRSARLDIYYPGPGEHQPG
jgi:RNA polymerase sigma factor (sigma-70 family)